MTIKECIDIVDNAKPNQYGIKEKVMWLSFVDETIINDVLKTHEGYDGRFDNFEGYTEDKLSVPLIVPSPYDRLYPQYIKMMIDSENGETARYNNSAALYNTYLNEYKKYYNKTHMPINATQKIPSPVSININSALSEAQIEYIKRQLYYMLSQDVGEVISHDKLYGIVTSYVNNNIEMIRANDGKDGKDGEKGTTIHTVENFGLGKTTPVGMYFVNNKKGATNGTMYKDFTMPKGFVYGDLLFDGKNGLMFDHDYREYSYIKDGVTYFETYDAIWCIANLNGTVPEGKYANIDLSNVSDEDFKAKAEAAGVGGDAGLADEKNFMVFKGVVSELPETANEGEVYKVDEMESLGVFVNDCEFTMTSTRINFNGENGYWGNVAGAIYNNWNWDRDGEVIYKFVIDGNTYLYTECQYNGAGENYFEMNGKTADVSNDITVPIGANVAVYKCYGEAKAASYIYHNGGFVEL